MTNQATIPNNLIIKYNGFDDIAPDHEWFNYFKETFLNILTESSKIIDIKNLDGITICNGHDYYLSTLKDLDRGFKTNTYLQPTSGDNIGVAMSPAVLRFGKLKSYIVFNINCLLELTNFYEDNQEFWTSLNILQHECAHVEIKEKINDSFPSFILNTYHTSLRDIKNWEIIMGCFEEYEACYISALKVGNQNQHYIESLRNCLSKIDFKINENYNNFIHKKNVFLYTEGLYEIYKEFLIVTSYYLGNKPEQIDEDIKTNPYYKYIKNLEECLSKIHKEYGIWKNKTSFEEIGVLMDKILKDEGIIFYKNIFSQWVPKYISKSNI